MWSEWTPQPDPVGVVHGEAGVTDPEVMHFHKEKSCLFHSLQIFLNWLFMFLLAARRYIWATESRNLLKQTPNVWIIKYDTCPIFHPEFTPKAGQHVRHSQGGLIGRIQSALYTEDLALLDLDVMRVYGKETTDLKKMHQMAQFSFIYGIKKAGLWKFFCLEMSENICFIFGIKKAGLGAYFWPWNV